MTKQSLMARTFTKPRVSHLLALLLVSGGYAITLPIADDATAQVSMTGVGSTNAGLDAVTNTFTAGSLSAGTFTAGNFSAGLISTGVLSAGTLTADMGTVGNLSTVQASATTLSAGTLTATSGTVTNLSSTNATVSNLTVTAATATSLSAGAITTGTIQGNVASGISTLSINTQGQTATTIGSTTAGSTVVLQSSAGNVTVNNSGVSIQGTTPNSQINIGTQGGQVNIGNASGGSTVNFNNNRLTGVAAGINGTDAVNVNQLNSAVNNLQNQINTSKAAIAGVVAATNLPGLQAGQTVNFGIAWGNYSNQNGMSVGGHVRLADEVVLKVSGSATSGVYSGGVGLGIGF